MAIDYDKFGYCVLCHENLMKTVNTSNGPVTQFSGKAKSMDLNLNDGSKMRVTICADCKEIYDHEKHSDQLMESVIRGWDKECDILIADESKPDWTPEKKKSYMDSYSLKGIIS